MICDVENEDGSKDDGSWLMSGRARPAFERSNRPSGTGESSKADESSRRVSAISEKSELIDAKWFVEPREGGASCGHMPSAWTELL
jgi:hypothetical protein